MDMKVKFAGFETLIAEDLGREVLSPSKTNSVLDAVIHKAEVNTSAPLTHRKFGLHNDTDVSQDLGRMEISEKVDTSEEQCQLKGVDESKVEKITKFV